TSISKYSTLRTNTKIVNKYTNIFVSLFFFSSRRRHTRSKRDWSSDVCSSDLFLVSPGLNLQVIHLAVAEGKLMMAGALTPTEVIDRKSTRLNSSHVSISYAVFCLKKKK